MPVAALAGLAASLAGTGMSIASANSARREQDRVLSNAIRQQNELSQQAAPVFAQSLRRSSPAAVQQSIGAGTQQALSDYQRLQNTQLASAANPAMALSTGTVSGDPLIVAQQRVMNQSAAGLAGYDRFAVDQAINNLLTQGKLNTLHTLSQNASSTLPLELQGAQQTNASLAGAGSLLQSIGATAGMYGLTQPKKQFLTITPGAGSNPGWDY